MSGIPLGRYIEAARTVMGEIDLDPASSAIANETVRAARYFDREADGLKHDWPGKVWFNPPYGRIGPALVERLLDQYARGITTAAVLLVAPQTSARWFQPLYGFPLCFTNHRIRFIEPVVDPGKGRKNQPAHGNIFAYLGPHPTKFATVFRQFGEIMMPSRAEGRF